MHGQCSPDTPGRKRGANSGGAVTGGAGGVGVQFAASGASFTNCDGITGGNGAGIVGTGLTSINSGTITGGLANAGAGAQANAITLRAFTRPQIAQPAYSITSSAMARSVGGIVRPSAFAALALITSSNFVARTMGRSAGLAPLRMRPT